MNHFIATFLGVLIAAFTISHDCFSQSTKKSTASFRIYNADKIEAATDVENALYVDRTRKIRLASSPKGSGAKIEAASSKAKDPYYFEKEHNVVWIKFRADRTSQLAFTIVPDSTKDDYDFLLFKAEGPSALSQIQNRELKPIRSNISRTRNIEGGITGLRLGEEHTHTMSGINASFSQPIETKEGELYYLVIDNVYENGGGAFIEFMYFEEKVITGTVVDSDRKPVEADVVWESKKMGTELVSVKSNPENGKFEITVPYDDEAKDEYTLSIFADDCFFEELTYLPTELEAKTIKPIEVVLPKLKKGEKAQLNCINFVGNKAIFIRSAYPSLKRLAKLMKRNKNLKVLIVGHTNGCANGVDWNQELSENRALATRDYLIEKGISADRIKTDGKNCEEMLYPLTSRERLQALNRRIEVHVMSY
jgi:outer membrane protein OmpA-like peptidoglycan-associated protein